VVDQVAHLGAWFSASHRPDGQQVEVVHRQDAARRLGAPAVAQAVHLGAKLV
jgi:hypothetical protein